MLNRIVPLFLAFSFLIAAQVRGAESTHWNFKKEMLSALVESVPALLKMQNSKTGRFGSGIPVAADQMPIFPLATAWATKDSANPYYHDPKLLESIMSGGDVLAKTQDKTGQWEFRKKDNSYWGMHFNPWLYSRWIRAFALIRDAMPTERRARWEKALTLGFTGIARSGLTHVHNIPAHHAMGLYIAGKTLNRPDWCEKASKFLETVAEAQFPDGFWSENYGPVVAYNFSYIDSLGIYYALSHDEKVRPALERGARFHANFRYPNGVSIETIDERNPYAKEGHLAGPGFSFSPEGRAYLLEEWKRVRRERGTAIADEAASMLLCGEEGTLGTLPGENGDSVFVTGDEKASVVRQGPWCGVFSAYVCPISNSRWIQDRQNFISLFHSKIGLILGGGNTKLQPLWSTFTVGDTKLLKHKAGDKSPNFSEPAGLLHVPSRATLKAKENLLELQYGKTDCSVQLELVATNQARIILTANPAATNLAVAAHLTFLPEIEKQWRSASGKTGAMKKPFELTSAQAGAWFEHNGWRVDLPKGSRLTWPAMRHNPYRDDGRSDLGDARIVLTLPFSQNVMRHEVKIKILE